MPRVGFIWTLQRLRGNGEKASQESHPKGRHLRLLRVWQQIDGCGLGLAFQCYIYI